VIRRALVLLGATALLAGCGSSDEKPASTPKPTATATSVPLTNTSQKPELPVRTGPAPKHLVIKDIVKGKGKSARTGDKLTVQYSGWLYDNGQPFDNSWDRGQPFQFQLGGQVIPGWNKGMVGMKSGGRRELIIPPNLAYGPAGSPPTIPANAPLVFVVDLQQIG